VETLAYVAIRIIAFPVPKTNVICVDRNRAEPHANDAAKRPLFWYSNLISGFDGQEGNNLG